MRISVYAFSLFFCCSALIGKGHVIPPAIVLRDTTHFIAVGQATAILEDKTAQLSLAQVRQRIDFVPSHSDYFQYGFSSSAYWLRLNLDNRNRENEEHWLISLKDAISLDFVDVYLVYPNGRVIHQAGGRKRPHIDQGFYTTIPFFRVELPLNQPVSVYIRLESSQTLLGQVVVWNEYYHIKKNRVVTYMIWLFLGLFVLRTLNSFVLARFIPNPQFRFYIVCTLLLHLMVYARMGTFAVLLDEYPRLRDWMHAGLGRLFQVGLAGWLYALLAGRPAFRLVRWVLVLVMGANLIGAVLPLLVQNAQIAQFYDALLLLTYGLFLMGAVLIGVQPQRPSLYLVLPVALCTIPLYFYQLQSLKLIPYSPVIGQAIGLALITEMVSMSLVLGRIVQSYIKERIATANALMQEKLEVGKLQELNTLKTHFFTNVSHELRTPLTLISGPLSDLKKRLPDEPLLPLMERNSNRLQNLINQLLDMSKLEAGQLKTRPEPGDIVVFFRNLTSSFESLAMGRQILFTVTQNKPEHWVDLDRDNVEKIATNLLSNAFKFTPPGRAVSVDVQCTATAVQFSVADTGIGIAPQHLPHIFERFYQGSVHTADRTMNRPYEGTGVGLSLVRELVELLQGTITVESTRGVGTRFCVTLPLLTTCPPTTKAVQPSPAPVWQAEPMPVDAPGQQPAGMENILLIIDDNDDMRDYVRSIFEADYHVIEAIDGQDGLDKASATLPDIVICDLMMPRLDGFAFCRTLKSQETTSHIPVVMLTALATLENRIEGLELGADEYLTKPFDRQELTVRVRNLLQKQALLQQYFSQVTSTSPEPAPVAISSREDAFLQKARAIIDDHLARPDFTIEQFCRQMGMSQSQLVRKLKALTGQTAVEYLRNYRLERAAERLKGGDSRVSEVAFEVGFESLSYFSRSFQDKYGVNPSLYGSYDPA